MINGNLCDFLEQVYWGEEVLFLYGGEKYFLQGWTEKDQAVMVLDIWDKTEREDYIWKTTAQAMETCAEQFLEAPVFGGKTFWQAEPEIQWLDW